MSILPSRALPCGKDRPSAQLTGKITYQGQKKWRTLLPYSQHATMANMVMVILTPSRSVTRSTISTIPEASRPVSHAARAVPMDQFSKQDTRQLRQFIQLLRQACLDRGYIPAITFELL